MLYYLTYRQLSLKHSQEAARVTTSICTQLKNHTLPIVKINESDIVSEDARNSLNMSVPDHWHIFSTINQEKKQHYMAQSSVFIIAVIVFVIILPTVLLIIGWLCQNRLGRLGTWMKVRLTDLQEDYREFRFLYVPPEPAVCYQRRGRILPEAPRSNNRRGEQV